MFKQQLRILNLVPRYFHNQPDFTQHKSRITRGNFKKITEEDVQYFGSFLCPSRILRDSLEKYNVDWFRQLCGGSSLVLIPKTPEEVSKILSYCNIKNLAVCPQGGHTGVSGAGTPIFDEIVLSAELMNKIINLDEKSGVLLCESGCILQQADELLAQNNLIFPLDLGAKGTCQVGGNVSTNAGGLRLIKYGNLHGNILGLEVVKADGTILNLLSSLKKDNTGYHLKHLFIGSEGTLGFITKVAIQCLPRPKSKIVSFLGLQNFDKVLETFYKCKHDLNEILTAFEVIDTPSMQLVNEKLGLQSPIGDYPFYVLIEASGSNEMHDSEKLNQFLETSLKKNFILNGTVCENSNKSKAVWDIRERIPEAFLKDGYVFMYDLTLPLANYYRIVEDLREHMGDKSHRVFGFGHLGDGNIHLHVSVKEYNTTLQEYIEPYIFELTKSYNGSITAEHGLGFLKAKYLNLVKTPEAIELMKSLKKMMDPNGILNPYKVLM